MPQMSPMYWFILLMYFIYVLMVLIMMIFYFTYMYPKYSNMMLLNNNFMHWSW